MNGFTAREVLPGVFHISDAMGVYMTLLAGEERALLVDTGYGLDDVASYIGTVTGKPLTVMLTHAHHDHALGARWFGDIRLFQQDLPAWPVYTGENQRRSVAAQAAAKGLFVPEDYLSAPMPVPSPIEEGEIDLGGMKAQVILCPGHTMGSAAVYVPERQLLLTGDDWNPTTWLFFPEALPAKAYRENVRALLGLPFAHVLCSHREALYPRAELEAFLDGLTDEALFAAKCVDMGRRIDTREANPAPGQQFVFDFGKAFGHMP
ncbi:MAG: MBL fold metallo-hydrolase [Clostridia bacterium]|nr:MBL fold metallo-hydrolase [Clostridia bacterium]